MNISKSPIGLLPYPTAYLGLTSGTIQEEQLKLATVLYEQTIFPVRTDHLQSVLRIVSDQEGMKLRDLETAWVSFDSLCPPHEIDKIAAAFIEADWNLVCDTDGHLLPDVEFAVDRELKQQFGRLLEPTTYGYFRELRGLVVNTSGAIEGWKHISRHTYCSLIGFTELDAVLASRFLDASGACIEFVNRLDVLIPSVRHLPWALVLNLRNDGRIRDFRDWYWGRSIEARSTDDKLRNEMVSGLWNAVNALKLDVGSETLKALVSNLPLPIPVNPASIALAAKSIKDATHFQHDYGWLLFILASQTATGR